MPRLFAWRQFTAVVLNLFWLAAHFSPEFFFAAHQKLGKV